jgi:hypothetical protein
MATVRSSRASRLWIVLNWRIPPQSERMGETRIWRGGGNVRRWARALLLSCRVPSASPTSAASGSGRGCFVKLRQSTTPRVVGEVPEILARMRLRSHHREVFGASVMVVSHDLLIHLSLDRFVKQPRRQAAVARRLRGNQSTCVGAARAARSQRLCSLVMVHVASRASVSAITATGARTTLALSAAPHRSEHQRSGCATEVFVGARTWRAAGARSGGRTLSCHRRWARGVTIASRRGFEIVFPW